MRAATTSLRAACVAALLLIFATPAQGQQTGSPQDGGDEAAFFPAHSFLVTGYGATSFRSTFAEDATPNDFNALLAPVLLFQVSDRFLFEGELEFELEEGVTVTSLEYAQIDYTVSNNLKLIAGKFLLPFNTFIERRHPTWINPMVSPPPVYGHHGGAGPTDPLLPILSDVGVQVRGTFNVGRFGYLTAAGFATQGPALETEGEEEAGHEAEDGHGALPEVAFGTNFEDNNEDKMFGGRLGFGVAPYFEVNLSALTGAYDVAGDLRFTGYGAHLEGRYAGFVLHSEWLRTEQEIAEAGTPPTVETLDRDGYYVQLSYLHGKWQPLVRWSQIFAGDLEGETAVEGGDQLGIGLSYWIQPSLVVKLEYLVNYEGGPDVDNNRLALQWGFGF